MKRKSKKRLHGLFGCGDGHVRMIYIDIFNRKIPKQRCYLKHEVRHIFGDVSDDTIERWEAKGILVSENDSFRQYGKIYLKHEIERCVQWLIRDEVDRGQNLYKSEYDWGMSQAEALYLERYVALQIEEAYWVYATKAIKSRVQNFIKAHPNTGISPGAIWASLLADAAKDPKLLEAFAKMGQESVHVRLFLDSQVLSDKKPIDVDIDRLLSDKSDEWPTDLA